MAIDFKQGKKLLQEKQKREKLAEKERKKNGTRYKEDDFLYPAKLTTEAMLEEAEMKNDVLILVAKQVADIVNMAGIDADFELDADFNEMLATNDLNDIGGVMYLGKSRKEETRYIIEVNMVEEQGGVVGFSMSMMEISADGLRVFDGEKWNSRREEGPQGLLHRLMSRIRPESPEAALLRAYHAGNENMTERGWEKFRRRYASAAELIGKTDDILVAVRTQEGKNDEVYLMPKSAMNPGVALKCTPEGFVPHVFFDENGLLCGYEYRAAVKSPRLVYCRPAGEAIGMKEAVRFVEWHMDRNGNDRKAVTIPLSETNVLHLTDDALAAPELITMKAKERGADVSELVEKIVETRARLLAEE